MSNQKKKKDSSFTTKKCYDCSTYLPLNAEICTACKKKVGKVNEYGIAEKPTDWIGYIVSFLLWAALFVFIWKAFIQS